MIAALLVFILVVGLVLAGYWAVRTVPAAMAERRVELRLREMSQPAEDVLSSVVVQQPAGPLPALDKMIEASLSTVWLSRLVEQSGVKTTPGAVLLMSVALGATAALAGAMLIRNIYAVPVCGITGLVVPFAWLFRKRSVRVAKFEEQFPDALDLMARAVRAGHAFPSTLGMVADEMPVPVGPEFRKTFDQQNFGLPLREALDGLASRVPLLDIKFFVTAVAIQRESGGNLSEILENLGQVVRERFKIRRQVRTHTAHGRFTGYVLLALPAALAAALSYINPEQMQLLFREPMGQMMLVTAVVMQTVGFFWIRQVIKIEV